MSSTSRSDSSPDPIEDRSPAGYRRLFPFLIGAGIVLLIEAILWMSPVERFESSESALIESTRRKIESGRNNYRVLIFGDSRSMSLAPLGDEADPQRRQFPEVYNFSLPAMGTRYYTYYLRKYLQAGNRKPEAILFAGSPLLLTVGKGETIIDPSLHSYARPDMDLTEYLKRRSLDRLAHLSDEVRPRPERVGPTFQEADWEFFSGRYLRLFSAREAGEQYHGPERFFLVSSSLPFYFQTYRFREAILNIVDPSTYAFGESYYGTARCTCEHILEPVCSPPSSRLQDNTMMVESRERTNGMYNISNRLSPARRKELAEVKQQFIQRLHRQSTEPPGKDFSVVALFLDYLQQEGIRYYYVNMPFPAYFENSVQLSEFDRNFNAFLERYAGATRLRFPTEFISEDYFSDQVHLNCEGASKVNREFTGAVLPALFKDLDAKKRSQRNITP